MLDFGYYNMDCMEGMKSFPDNYFDLAIVDPPYYSNAYSIITPGGNLSTTGIQRRKYKMPHWIPPEKKYFEELFRVSKEQIIFGINYFDINPGSGRIVWDKVKDNGTDFSDCEIAYCSLIKHVKIYRYMWNGMIQGSRQDGTKAQGNKALNEKRIHPTQKPVALYEWLLTQFARQGDVILDTHVGSASSLIACHNTNHHYVGFELDAEYYAASRRRLDMELAQINIFDLMGDGSDDQIQGQTNIMDFLEVKSDQW